MAGGIFPNYPFELNAKCVIFSIIIIGLFFYKPPEMNIYWKSFTSFVLFVLAYVSMSWYDYKFDCQKLALKKSASSLGITGLFKPPAHTPSQTDKSKMTPEEKDLDWALINVYHLLILAPLFLYVGINKNESNQVSIILLIVNFAFAILYHGVRVFTKFNFISWAHILVSVGGIYLSTQDKKPDWFFNTLIGLGIYAGLKHGMYLTQTFH
jgi:hypothetical protein